jgi:pimeloyl-ACP methyl ester carboxylesterase
MGGNILVNVALMHPRLFTTLVLFEGVFYKKARSVNSLGAYPITFRKDFYPSREAAAKSFRKHPVYRTWDPAVLDLFIKYGLRDLPTAIHPTSQTKDAPEPVTLTTTKHQEATSFTRAAFPPQRSTPLTDFVPVSSAHPEIGDADFRNSKEAFYRPEPYLTFFQLPYLRPSCLWLNGDQSIFMNEKWMRADKAAVCGTGFGGSGGVAAGRVEELELSGGGHFMPFEAPRQMAVEALGPWLDKEVGRWAKEVTGEREAWNEIDKAKKSQLSDDWLWWMKEHHNPKKATTAARSKL